MSLLEEVDASTSNSQSSSSTAAGSSSSSSKHSSGLFSKTDETILDHPMRLNLEETTLHHFLGIDGSGEDNVWLEKLYCGASGTAMVLNDGRCFVMGSNKNGELG